MKKSINSLKAAMVIAVLGLAGLFTSCSSDNASTIDPVTPSAQVAQTKAEVTKGKLICTYMIGDSVLDYADVKIVYTDASGKQQTQPIEKSKLVQSGIHKSSYTFNIETTTFPATLTAKLEVTPKQDAIDNAKTGAWIALSKYYEYDTYDKNGKEISSQVLLGTKTDVSGMVQVDANGMKEYFNETLNQLMATNDLDKTLTVTAEKNGATHDLN